MVDYYETGQKEAERVFRNGKLLCSRGWDLQGEPNDSMVEDGEGYDLVTYPDGSKLNSHTTTLVPCWFGRYAVLV